MRAFKTGTRYKKSKKAFSYDTFSSYYQVKKLMGQAALDRYLLGGDAYRWDVPTGQMETGDDDNESDKGESEDAAQAMANLNVQEQSAKEAAGEEETMESDSAEDEVTKAANDAAAAVAKDKNAHQEV